MGAGHPHHIQLARCYGMPRRRHIGDARSVESGHPHFGFHAARKIKVRGRFHAVNRDNIGHGGIGMDAAFDDVQKVDQAAVAEHFANRHPVIRCNTACLILICGIAHPQKEGLTHPFAHGGQNLHRKARTVFKAAAIGGGQGVGEG